MEKEEPQVEEEIEEDIPNEEAVNEEVNENPNEDELNALREQLIADALNDNNENMEDSSTEEDKIDEE